MKVRVGSSEIAPHDSGRNSTEMDARRTRWLKMRGKVLEVEPTRLDEHCGGGSSGYVLTPAQAAALG